MTNPWSFTQLICTLVNIIVCTQEVAVPEVLYEEVIEVDERVVLRQDGCQLPGKDRKRIVTGAKQLPVLFPKGQKASHYGWNPKMLHVFSQASNSANKNTELSVHCFCPDRTSQL